MKTREEILYEIEFLKDCLKEECQADFETFKKREQTEVKYLQIKIYMCEWFLDMHDFKPFDPLREIENELKDLENSKRINS